MLRQSIRKVSQSNDLLFLIIASCGFGLILGLISIWFPPLLVLGALAAILFMYATIKRPEIGLLGILVATSSIVFENQLPVFNIGVGSLNIVDVILLLLLVLIGVRSLVNPEFKIVRTPLDWPLLIFYGVMMLSTFIAIYHSSVDVVAARRMIRVLTYYLTFFVVTNLVRERRQLNLLLNGFFLLATIVAVAMIVQYVLGTSFSFLPGRVETLVTQDTVFAGVARLIPPGYSIVVVAIAAIFCILVQEQIKSLSFLKFLQFSLLGIAILTTFIRAYWAALIFVFFLSAYLVRGQVRQRLLGWLIVFFFLSAAVVLYGFLQPKSQVGKSVGAVYDRLDTLWSANTLNESSLQWRYLENQYALPSIISHPWLGLGFGARYRPWDPRLDGPTFDARGYIHNGHLWILLDSGLFGYFAFIWLSLTFLIRGFRYWRSVASGWLRGVVLGFTLVFIATLIANVALPDLTAWDWTPVLGIVMGINEVILIRFMQEE